MVTAPVLQWSLVWQPWAPHVNHLRLLELHGRTGAGVFMVAGATGSTVWGRWVTASCWLDYLRNKWTFRAESWLFLERKLQSRPPMPWRPQVARQGQWQWAFRRHLFGWEPADGRSAIAATARQMSPLFERGRFLSNGRLGISPQLPQCVSWLRFHVFPVPHCRCETIEVRCDLFLLSLFSCRILLTCRRVQETNRREGKGHGEDNSKAQAEPPTKQHNTEEPQHERNQRKARPQKQTMSVSGVFFRHRRSGNSRSRTCCNNVASGTQWAGKSTLLANLTRLISQWENSVDAAFAA